MKFRARFRDFSNLHIEKSKIFFARAYRRSRVTYMFLGPRTRQKSPVREPVRLAHFQNEHIFELIFIEFGCFEAQNSDFSPLAPIGARALSKCSHFQCLDAQTPNFFPLAPIGARESLINTLTSGRAANHHFVSRCAWRAFRMRTFSGENSIIFHVFVLKSPKFSSLAPVGAREGLICLFAPARRKIAFS